MTAGDPIAQLREQIRGLLSQLDTAVTPRPDFIIPADSARPGPEWHPTSGWVVRCIDDGFTNPTCVYITSPEHVGTDMTVAGTTEARRLAMAILAACDHADATAAGLPRITPRPGPRPVPPLPPRGAA